MSRKPTTKTFDALAFKEQAQAEIFEAIRDLTPEAQIAYCRRRAESGPLGARVKSVKRATEECRQGTTWTA